MINKVSQWVKQNRKKCYFEYSTYSLLKTEDSSTETWMNIDAYKDQQTYEEFTKVFKKSNPDYAAIFKIEEEIHSIIVPNSIIYEIYIEKPELRIT